MTVSPLPKPLPRALPLVHLSLACLPLDVTCVVGRRHGVTALLAARFCTRSELREAMLPLLTPAEFRFVADAFGDPPYGQSLDDDVADDPVYVPESLHEPTTPHHHADCPVYDNPSRTAED